MNILKFEDYKTVNDFIIANEGGRDEEEYKTIVYKSGNKFGAITTREVFGEEVLDISELLTSLYDTPEQPKSFFLWETYTYWGLTFLMNSILET